MIEIKNLEKKYGKFVAIKDFNLKIEEGKTYGILARKNSGGTTIFKILCNYIFEDSGEVLIDGKTPENARDLIYLCPKMRFYEKYTMRKILNMISEYNKEFDLEYALELCENFKLNIDKKLIANENINTYTIFKTIVTICMKKKYILIDKPEIGVSSLEIRKLSDLLMGNVKRNKYTPIIHSKNVSYFFDYLDEIIIIKDKKVVLFESREKLNKMVYSISGTSELIGSAIEGKNVIAVRTLRNFSKLKVAYIMADSEEEARKHSSRRISLKEIYEAITAPERGFEYV